MNSVEKTVGNIKLLIASGDLSDSPQLRQLHSECLQIFRELNSNLEQCRILIANGSIQAARQMNCSFEPSLTAIAEQLEFFRTNDFFAICKEYDLEMPVFPDEKLLVLLSAPASSGEKRLHALLQDYRKIARNGTMQQRIALLRQIVKKLPDSSRWRNDLISAERSRYQEIESELKQLPQDSSRCQKLEELYREIISPEWQTAPKTELAENIRTLLLPLQKEKLAKEVEAKIELIQDCWLELDIARMEKELEKWRVFSSNPMISLSAEQKQSINDAEAFLKSQAEEARNKQISQALIRKIEQKLADNLPYTAIAGDYNQLQLMDCQIPVALSERLKALEEESRQYEHLRSLRRSVFGICGAVLLVTAVVFAVKYVQHYLAVKRNAENMQNLIAEGHYDEAIKLYKDLTLSSAKVGADPQLLLLRNTAESEKKEAQITQMRAQAAFKSLLAQIRTLAEADMLDNADALTKAIGDAEKISAAVVLPQEMLDEFSNLKTAVSKNRTSQKLNREQQFLNFCSSVISRVNALIHKIPTSQPAELDISLNALKHEMDNKLSSYQFIPDNWKEREKKNFQKAVDTYNEAWKKEKAFRKVNAPVNFNAYLAALEAIRYEYVDLSQKYRRALALTKEWQKVYDNSRKFIPNSMDAVQEITEENYGNGLCFSDFEKILPSHNRSQKFKTFFATLQKQKDLKELVFTDVQGKDFFFYISGRVTREKLRRPARTNIIFIAIAAANEKNRRFILSFNSKNKETPFVITSKHPDLPYALPSGFAVLSGEKDVSEKLINARWPGHELATTFSSLSNDGPGINAKLQEALLFIWQQGNVKNPYLKELLLIHFLDELAAGAPRLYFDLDDKLQELKNFYDSRQPNWRAPQANSNYAAEIVQLQEKWNQLDLERMLKAGKLRGDFVCSSYARRLKPVGIIQSIDDGKVKIHLFEGRSAPVEGLIFEDKSLFILPEESWKGTVPVSGEWRRRLFAGQLIWSFDDGISSPEFVREWQKKARDLNTTLKIKPLILPQGIGL